MKKTGPTNPLLQELIQELKDQSRKTKVDLWRRIADDLEKPSRRRASVNIFKIDAYAKDGETAIVPGKVLATGELKKKIKVAALSFSAQAENKIKDRLTISELMKSNPKGNKVRIIC